MGQGQSGPQGPQGPPGGRGDAGPQGPPGTPGKDASGDPQQVASFLSSDGTFASKLAPMVAKDNAIGIAVAEKVANEQIPRQLVTNALLTNKAFSDKLIDSMAVDTRFRGSQGPPGSAFDELSIQSALQPKSMWCADGQMCRIPTSTPGTYLTGDTVIQRSKNLYLGGATLSTSGGLVVDTKHGVVVKDDNPVDGPFLYGAAGGNLGTFSQATSATTPSATLTWDANDIKVKNNLFVGGNLIQTAHDLKLGYKNFERGDSGESRALVKDNDNTLKINYMGDYAGGTTVDGKDLEISGGVLKIKDWTIKQNENNNLTFSYKDNHVASVDTDGKIWSKSNIVAENDIKGKHVYIGNDWKLTKGNSNELYFDYKDLLNNNLYRAKLETNSNFTLNGGTLAGFGPWKIYSEGGNGALTFDNGTTKHFKIHTNNISQFQLGSWRVKSEDKELAFNYEGMNHNAFKIRENGNLWRHGDRNCGEAGGKWVSDCQGNFGSKWLDQHDHHGK